MTLRVKASPGFYLYLSLAALILPLPWLCGLLVAAFVHEMGHFMALSFMKIPIRAVSMNFGGAKIYSSAMTLRQEKLAALAGPASGFVLCLLFPFFPEAAICAAFQTAFNLLPIGSFDGKRIFCSRKNYQ